jgi:inositol 1,4,5-triphosphate receptor type 1
LPVFQEQYRGIEEVLKKCLKMLKALARGNDVVQMKIFERLDRLLKIKVVEPELAITLKEVKQCIMT